MHGLYRLATNRVAIGILEAAIAHSDELAGIVLSLRDGQVWASWRDERTAVMLGDHDEVLAAMRDFIRQSELGERLTQKPSNDDRAET